MSLTVDRDLFAFFFQIFYDDSYHTATADIYFEIAPQK